MKSAVVVFPGSNRDRDMIAALTTIGGKPPAVVWHKDTSLPVVDLIVIPGGFSYGDYLRSGAIAARSPIMAAVRERAAKGVHILGVCNGFQVLTEAGLLPGALQKNRGLKFLCTTVDLDVASTNSALTNRAEPGARLRVPINHFEGNYTCSPDTLAELESDDRVVLRYADNPNGSVGDIAGICSAERNVVGLMPHPERAYDPLLGSGDGRVLLESLLAAAGVTGAAAPSVVGSAPAS